jgi:hypothetical protein
MVWLVRHRQTKGPETDRPNLNHRATSLLYKPADAIFGAGTNAAAAIDLSALQTAFCFLTEGRRLSLGRQHWRGICGHTFVQVSDVLCHDFAATSGRRCFSLCSMNRHCWKLRNWRPPNAVPMIRPCWQVARKALRARQPRVAARLAESKLLPHPG